MLAAAVSALVVASRTLLPRLPFEQLLARIEGLGTLGLVLYVLLYVLASLLFLPASVLTLAAGALFGLAKGVALVSLGSTLGATAAFLTGRHLARDRVARKLASYPRFRAVDRAIEKEGFTIVGLLRLSPVLPFALVNYALGVTRVRLRHFVLASWLGMLPATVTYVYVGTLARLGSGDLMVTTGARALYGVGLLATVAVTVVVTRLARRALRERLPEGEDGSGTGPPSDGPRPLPREAQ